MKKNENPKNLFEQISEVRNQFNTKKNQIDEADLIAVVLNAASDEYKAVLTNEQRAHKKDGDLRCAHLAKAMQEHYRLPIQMSQKTMKTKTKSRWEPST